MFLGGGIGYVAWYGTQHNPNVPRSPDGIPRAGAGTLAVIGDAKQMSSEFIKGASFIGYGATMFVGIGVPIPIIDEEIGPISLQEVMKTSGHKSLITETTIPTENREALAR